MTKEIYNFDEFVARHATNLWGDTAIEGISSPKNTRKYPFIALRLLDNKLTDNGFAPNQNTMKAQCAVIAKNIFIKTN